MNWFISYVVRRDKLPSALKGAGLLTLFGYLVHNGIYHNDGFPPVELRLTNVVPKAIRRTVDMLSAA